jgi:hypothetical protein
MMILKLHALENELEIHAIVVRMACCVMINSSPTAAAEDGAVAVDAVNERGVIVQYVSVPTPESTPTSVVVVFVVVVILSFDVVLYCMKCYCPNVHTCDKS